VYSAGMYPSGERAQCLRQVILQKRFYCHSCGSASFIIRNARFSTMESPTLEVGLRCANCGTTDSVSLSVVEARRCGFEEPASS
jgi:RNase P subunit RPR2